MIDTASKRPIRLTKIPTERAREIEKCLNIVDSTAYEQYQMGIQEN